MNPAKIHLTGSEYYIHGKFAMATMHLIRFPNKKEHKRGIMALLDVAVAESLGLRDYQMVVTDEHIKALERAKVSFTYLSETAANGRVKRGQA